MTRSITVHLDATEITQRRLLTDPAKLNEALGYLAQWNLTFPHVDIYPDDDTDLVAVYKTAEGTRGYVIGAVWHDDHYGFHS